MFSKSAHEHKDSSGKYLTEHLVEGTFKKLQRKSLQKYSDVAVSSLVAAPRNLKPSNSSETNPSEMLQIKLVFSEILNILLSPRQRKPEEKKNPCVNVWSY